MSKVLLLFLSIQVFNKWPWKKANLCNNQGLYQVQNKKMKKLNALTLISENVDEYIEELMIVMIQGNKNRAKWS